MKNQDNEIRIYVACLASYNHGILHGKWINACQEQKEIWAEIKTMLSTSQIIDAEEFAIHGAIRSRIQRVGILPPSNLLDGSQPRQAY